MKKQIIISFGIFLLLSMILSGCGGYANKDQLEKQLSDHKRDMDYKIQLAQDSALMANDKSDRALSATKGLDKMKQEIVSNADERINSAMASIKSENDDVVKRIAQDAADKAVSETKAFLTAEDEKIRQLAMDASDMTMKVAMEAEQRAQNALKQAELAKELPKPKTVAIYAVYFDPGKTMIKTEGIAELEKAAIAIRETPDAVVTIQGHADNTPVVRSKYRNNWLLSQVRAETVKEYLVSNLGVSENSINSSVGFAEYSPNASNDPGNKWQNRRTEIIITQ